MGWLMADVIHITGEAKPPHGFKTAKPTSPGQTGWPVPELAYQSPSKCNPQVSINISRFQIAISEAVSALGQGTLFSRFSRSIPHFTRRYILENYSNMEPKNGGFEGDFPVQLGNF